MPFRVFTIPLTDDGSACAAMNAVLRTIRVLHVDRQLAPPPQQAWTFCVEYLDGMASTVGSLSGKHVKVDWREILPADVFTRFAALRVWRKQAAEHDGLPVYAICTNEQLAALARANPSDTAGITAIDGLGAAKVAKYGPGILTVLLGEVPITATPAPA